MKRVATILKYAVLLAITLLALFPFYAMFIMGTHRSEDLFRQLQLCVGGYIGKNFATIIRSGFLTYYKNSFLVSVCATLLSVTVSAMAGYGLAKFRFRLRKFLYTFILVTMMVPAQLGIVAYVVQMRVMRMNDTLLPLIFYFSANAFSVYWMYSFISGSVSNEILESARIDGCREFGIFFRIALPLCTPALITVSMLIFLWSWNNYLLPLVVINKQSKFTMPLGLATLSTKYRSDLGAQMMEMTLGVFPIMLLFLFGLKRFIGGLTAGSLKG